MIWPKKLTLVGLSILGPTAGMQIACASPPGDHVQPSDQPLPGAHMTNTSSAVSAPHSPTEIVSNARAAFVSGSALDPAFYSGTALREALGGQAVSMKGRRDDRLWGEVTGFDSLITPAQSGSLQLPGLEAMFWWERTSAASGKGRVLLTFRSDSGISVSDVFRMFGSDWKPVLTTPQHGPGQSKPTSKPMANSVLAYVLPSGKGRARVELQLDSNANLKSADFQIEQ